LVEKEGKISTHASMHLHLLEIYSSHLGRGKGYIRQEALYCVLPCLTASGAIRGSVGIERRLRRLVRVQRMMRCRKSGNVRIGQTNQKAGCVEWTKDGPRDEQ
jgi:hypothetical protein